MMAAGLLSSIGLYLLRKTKSITAWFRFFFLFLMLAAIVSFGYTAKLGGQIRHSEISSITVPVDVK